MNRNERINVAKLLELSRPGRRVSNALRAWWAMRSQRRRRERNGGVAPAAPAISNLEQDGLGVLVWYTNVAAGAVTIRVYRQDVGLVDSVDVATGAGYGQGGAVDVGGTYAYRVTAVNAAGLESAPSLWVGIMISGV